MNKNELSLTSKWLMTLLDSDDMPPDEKIQLLTMMIDNYQCHYDMSEEHMKELKRVREHLLIETHLLGDDED